MAQISKYPVSKEVYSRIFEIFLKTISKLKTKRQVESFLKEFLTPTEQVMFAKRLAIAFLLTKKYDYRDISKILRVSTSTIRSVSVDLQMGDTYESVVRGILKDEEVEKFFKGVGEKVTKLLASTDSKSGTWRYLRHELEKDKRSKPF